MKLSKISTNGDNKYLGQEPFWSEDREYTDSDLMGAFNWYNYFCNRKNAKTFVVEYLSVINRSKEEISSIHACSDASFPTQVGWLARMMSLGYVPSDKTKKFFTESYEDLLKKSKVVKVVTKEETSTAPVISIQDRIREKVTEEISEIEGYIDQFILNSCKQKDDITSFLKSRQYSSVVSKRVCDVFIKRGKEIEEALLGEDEQLKEGYSNFTKPELKRFKELIDAIVTETNRIAENNKPVRKQRKVKEKPATVVVAKMNYLKEFAELNLKSVAPEHIVGASQVWTYNTKTKLLGMYNADNAKGLTVKGSTLQNYNDQTSVGKRLRKPEVILKDLLEAGKVKLKRILPDLTTKESTLTGRMNSDIIIVRIV